MKRMHLVWALVCAGCGDDPFSASEQEATTDGATVVDSGGAPSTVRFDDDAGAAGASSGGSGGEGADGAGGKPPPPLPSTDAGPDVAEGGAGGSDEGGAGGMPNAGAGGIGGDGGLGGGVGGVGGNTGGTGGCEHVTHDNGVGQTWQDCEPLGTYNNAQAFKACEAWCEVVGCASCWTAPACGETLAVIGSDGDTTIAWSRRNGSTWLTDSAYGGCVAGAIWR